MEFKDVRITGAERTQWAQISSHNMGLIALDTNGNIWLYSFAGWEQLPPHPEKEEQC